MSLLPTFRHYGYRYYWNSHMGFVMIARKQVSRKAKFAAALVEAGISPSTFAREIGGVSKTQLYRVLKDPANSAPLTAKIDAFINEHVGRQALAS